MFDKGLSFGKALCYNVYIQKHELIRIEYVRTDKAIMER